MDHLKNAMKNYRFPILKLLLLATLILATSCSEHTRYNILTFFFTGVPSPEDEKRAQPKAHREATAAVEERDRSIRSSHNYFTSKKCGRCHQTSFSHSFNRTVQGGMPTVSLRGEGTADNPRLPLKKICVSCHVNRSDIFASTNKLWLHAPVTKGNCIFCHVPHQSRYPALLRDKAENLCIMCHSEGLIKLTKKHRELKDCLKCHTPHLGRDKLLLIKDYKEVRRLPESTPDIPDRK